MSRWDKGVDYETMYLRIARHMKSPAAQRRPPGLGKKKRRFPLACYDAILLIQLKNASRVSEAVRAFREYLVTKRTELEVQVSKKRRKELRKMVIPQEVVEMDCNICLDLLDVSEQRIIDNVKHYSRKQYDVNTHSLRYSRITHLLKLGVDSAVIAKITRHSNVNFIRTYTQEKLADEILRNVD
ncbi:tyrosine-type recombinase/integrase [Thermofilum sp.]|jgi:integrase|uniref:tyrosine-type recombinase/integrase n=1 Tax=Thermofilum sp. TaxID=1961369 RepID=UPI0025842A77|nr:tyrosine-type recombinase/integrase [Thermofilum sp.]